MSYDDQRYSNVNPDTLEYQDWEEVALTVWTALRPCREVTARRGTLLENKAIRWAKPKKWNPDCGYEVLVPGKFLGRYVFASVALNIVGDDFEIYVQRRLHDLVLVFSTRDEGPILSPQARLQATVSKMLELTKQFDKWSRQQSLAEDFPTEWIGTPASAVIRSLIANRCLSSPWVGESWSDLGAALLREHVVLDDLSIESRSQAIGQSKRWSQQTAVIFSVATSVIFALGGCLVIGLHSLLGRGASWLWDGVLVAWPISWNALLNLTPPAEYAGPESWLHRLAALPIALLWLAFFVAIVWTILVHAMRHATALWLFSRSRVLRCVLVAGCTSFALALMLVSAMGIQEMAPSKGIIDPSAQGAGPDVHTKAIARPAAQEMSDVKLLELLSALDSDADSFEDPYAAQVWLTDMSDRLARQVENPEERLRILNRVHYESTRQDISPELVLAVIDVESNFDRNAVSVAGALGLMQVMPFWTAEIGRPGDNLVHIETNVRYGCTILKYYIDMENGDLVAALARYDGNRGTRDYANRVLEKLRLKWYRI